MRRIKLKFRYLELRVAIFWPKCIYSLKLWIRGVCLWDLFSICLFSLLIYSCRLMYLLIFLRGFNISFLRLLLTLNLIPLSFQTHNYRKTPPQFPTQHWCMAETSKNTATTPGHFRPNAMTYIAQLAANHSLRFSTGSEFSRTMEIRPRVDNSSSSSEDEVEDKQAPVPAATTSGASESQRQLR